MVLVVEVAGTSEVGSPCDKGLLVRDPRVGATGGLPVHCTLRCQDAMSDGLG
jgi:hypothetical protein